MLVQQPLGPLRLKQPGLTFCLLVGRTRSTLRLRLSATAAAAEKPVSRCAPLG